MRQTVFDLVLLQEQHSCLNVAHEIDFHSQLELTEGQILDRATIANGGVVYQNVNGAMISHDLVPQFLNLIWQCKVYFVKVHVRKAGYTQ